MKFHMEVSPHIRDEDWTGGRDKWLEFDVCMQSDNDKNEPHFGIVLYDNDNKEYETVIAEEISIRQLIDLHSFIGCVLKMRENK